MSGTLLVLLMPFARTAITQDVAITSQQDGMSKQASIVGDVVDQTGAPVEGARVKLLVAPDLVLSYDSTDESGSFSLESVRAKEAVLVVNKSGFEEVRQVVPLAPDEKFRHRIRLGVKSFLEDVTVTPARGAATEVFAASESVSVTTREDLSRRSYLLLPQALKETPGVHLQQTSTSQGSLFIRGLSGQQVVNLIDGVRFNNSTFRPGANQYLAFVDPYFADRIEVVRGPNSSQYGSDSLGGTVNVLTRPTGIGSDRFEIHGGGETFFASADRSAGGALHLSGGARRWGFVVGGSGRRAQDLRAGGGIDSRSVVTRLFGLSSEILGDRLRGTAYTQYGGHAKFIVQPTERDTLSVEYLRGTQLGARRYDQLDGGLGNLVNDFDPQTLDFAVARFSRVDVGFLDSLSATFSYNGQRDDRRFQNINNARTGLRSPVTDESNRADVFGYQAQAATRVGDRHSIAFGGEFYDEFIRSDRTELRYSGASGGFADAVGMRARFPNGAHYHSMGLFAQDVVGIVPGRLTGTFGVRYSRFGYRQVPDDNPRGANNLIIVPEFRTGFGDTTFNIGGVLSVTRNLNLTASVSRGFRAPNVSDFGAIGISGNGFEITPEEGKRLGGTVGRFNSASSSGEPRAVEQLVAETLYNYEGGAKLRTNRFDTTLSLFNSDIKNFIERRTLLLPQGATGTLVGGQQVIRQDATGAVYTALANTPVFVRANAGRLRLRGIETSTRIRLTRSLTATAHGFYVRGIDLETGLPPGLENGIPPATGFASLRWEPLDRKFWVESYSSIAGAQARLSDNDLQQARIGGIRTRDEITNFFNNGATARGLVSGGVLLPTGETLPEVLRRVLGTNLTARVPLYRSNPGYATFNLRGGYRFNENRSLTLIIENILDKNYRTMGSGVDAPGINAMVRFSHSF